MEYDDWVHFDGLVWCPRCNGTVSCDDNIKSILDTIPTHDCERDQGTGLYLRPPEVPEEGFYLIESDGTYTRKDK